MNFFELYEEQKELRSKMQVIVAKADTEKRSFEAEEQRSLDEMEARVKALDLKIAEERSKPTSKPAVEPKQTSRTPETRTFSEVIEEKRAVTTGSKNLIAVEINKDFIGKITEGNFVRRDSKVIPIVGKSRVPYVSNAGAAEVLAEGGTITPSAESISTIDFDSFRVFKQVPITADQMENPFVATEAVIDDAAVSAFVEGELGYFTYGSGTGQPQGLAVGGTLRAAVASASALTFAELNALITALKPKYRTGAKLYVGHDYENVLAAVVDGDAKPAYNRDLGTVFGIPVEVTEFLDKTTHKKPMVYANLAKGYAIAQRGSGVERTLFEEAKTLSWGANYSEFLDGRVLRADAIQVLQTP